MQKENTDVCAHRRDSLQSQRKNSSGGRVVQEARERRGDKKVRVETESAMFAHLYCGERFRRGHEYCGVHPGLAHTQPGLNVADVNVRSR